MAAVIKATVTLDGSGVGGAVVEINGQIAKIGNQVNSTMGSATSAVQEHERAWTSAGERIIDTLKEIAVAAGLAFSIDKMVEWVAHAIEGAEQIEHLSESLGISVQNLQSFNYVAGLTNTSVDAISTSLTRLERAQVEARDGNVQTAEAFRAVGVSATDMQGRLKPADELIVELSKKLSNMADGATKTAIMIQLMGRGAAESIPFFNAMGKEFDDLQDKAVALGLVLSTQDQKALLDTQESFDELGQEVKGLGNQFAVVLAPSLKAIAEGFGELIQQAALSGVFQEIGASVKFVVDNVNLLAIAIKALVDIKIAQWLAPMLVSVVSSISVWGGLAAEFGIVETAGAALATGLGSLATIAEGALAFIGGIPGLIALAVVAIYSFSSATDSAQAATNLLKDAQDRLNNTSAETVTQDLLLAESAKKKAAAEIADTQAIIANLEAQQNLNRARRDDTSGGFAAVVAGGTAEATAAQIDALKQHLKEAQDAMANLDSATNNANQDFHNFSSAVSEASHSFIQGDISGNTTKFVEASNKIHELAAQAIKDGSSKSIVDAQEDQALSKLRDSMDRAAKSQGNYNSQLMIGQSLAQQQAKDIASYNVLMDQLRGQLEGPYVKAQEDYNITLEKAHLQYLKDIQDHLDSAAAKQREHDIDVAAKAVRDQTTEQLKQQHDLMANANQDLQNQVALMGVAPQYQAAITDGLNTYDELLKTHYDFYGHYIQNEDELKSALDKQLPVYIAKKQVINDVSEAEKNNQQIESEWQGIVSSGLNSVGASFANFVTSGMKSWKDFGKSLVDDAKQFIGQVIQEFLKLTVFNGIMNSLFGTNLPTNVGSGLFGQLLGGASGGGGIGGAISGLFGGGAGGSSLALATDPDFMPGGALFGSNAAGSSNAINSLINANRGGGILNFLFGSGASFDATAGIGVIPAADSLGFVPDYAGTAGEGATTYGSTSSAAGGGFSVGTALNVAGAILAGYNEFKAAGGGIGGATGAAAYGTASFVAGSAITAGVTALAAGGTLAAAGTAAMAAIPVVGWIALAAVAVNMISGGKLFGTAGKVIGGSTTETVDASGADISSQYTTKGQRAFFGGAYYKSHDIAVDPKVQDAADAFFKSLTDDKQHFAESLGQTAGVIIGGTFVTEWDKNGKQTGTTTTINGQKYTGETQEQFAARLEAENFKQVLTGMGINVDSFTKSVQGDADKLLAATQDVGATAQQVTQDLKKGISLLDQDSTVADIVNEVIKLDDNGQTLVQTYADLQVGLLEYKNDMLLAGVTTSKTSAALLEYVHAAEKAAGGAQNFANLVAQYDKAVYSSGAQTVVDIGQIQQQSSRELSAIGLSAGISLQQFNRAFTAVKDSLSPEDLVKWYQAGVDLAALNDAITSLADAQQKYADFEVQTQGDAFTQSFAKAIEGMKSQIDTANKLAQAAGKAGASQADLAVAIQTGSVAVGKAIADLTQGIYNDINILHPKVIAGSSGNDAIDFYNANQAAKQAQQQDAAAKASAAFDLIKKLGDFAFVSGKSVTDVLKFFGLSSADIGSSAGESADLVEKQIAAAQDQAASLVKLASQGDVQTGLLENILNVLQGKAPTYNVGNASTDPTLTDPTAFAAAGGKIAPPRVLPPTTGSQVGQVQTPANVSAAGGGGPTDPSVVLPQIPKALNQGNDRIIDRLDRLDKTMQTFNNTINRYGHKIGNF